MSTLVSSYLLKTGIMEGYSYYLINSKKISQSQARMHINLVRMFHNYVGKPYVDIEQRDIISYMFFLREKEHSKDRSLYRHLASIKEFYEYLWYRGDIAKLPCDGVSVKNLKKYNLSVKFNKEGREVIRSN